MNKHIITGRIGQIRDLKRFDDGGAILNFTVATDRSVKKGDRWEKVSDWHNVTIGGRRASSLHEHLYKGLFVSVEGPSVTRKYTSREGAERYITEIRADDVTICWPPKNGAQRQAPADNGGGFSPPDGNDWGPPQDAFGPDSSDVPF